MAHRAYTHRTYTRIRKLWLQQLPPCAICGGPTVATRDDPRRVSVDHIKGVSSFPKGTPPEVINATGNLRPAHYACNIGRGPSQSGKGRKARRIQRHPGY